MQVQQFVAGRDGDRGTLVLPLHFDAAAKANDLKSSLSQQENLTETAGESLRFCVFQMVPWYFRLLFHTMRLQADNKL